LAPIGARRPSPRTIPAISASGRSYRGRHRRRRAGPRRGSRKSRLVAGERPLHRELEAALAAHYSQQTCVVVVSGHATNVSSIGALLGPKDLIVHDSLAHNSIVIGGTLSRAERRLFPHNDLDELDELLTSSRHRYERVLIAVEGLYSMDGDFPDLARLVEIKRRHAAWLMVDERTVWASSAIRARAFSSMPASIPMTSISGWGRCRRRCRVAAAISPDQRFWSNI
jgi:7-keto-8-aminopelargonate synthetase-like enzyme